MKNVTILFASLLLAFSSTAFAQDAPPFEDVDENGDGSVSSSELEAAGLDINIEDADTDGDGALSRSEYEAAVSDA